MAGDDGLLKDNKIQLLEDDIERANIKIQEKEEELTQHNLEVLSDLKVTLAKQEETIEAQRMEIVQLNALLQAKTAELNESEKNRLRVMEEVATVKSKFENRYAIQEMKEVMCKKIIA